MFGIEPLARIVRHDARIEVKVPAAKGKKAYSYFREGGEDKKKSSGVGKKAALIGGGLALAGLGAAAIAMNRKKPSEQVTASPAKVSEPEKKTNNTARNVAIGVGAAGLGAAAVRTTTQEKERGASKSQDTKTETGGVAVPASEPKAARVVVERGKEEERLKEVEESLDFIKNYFKLDEKAIRESRFYNDPEFARDFGRRKQQSSINIYDAISAGVASGRLYRDTFETPDNAAEIAKELAGDRVYKPTFAKSSYIIDSKFVSTEDLQEGLRSGISRNIHPYSAESRRIGAILTYKIGVDKEKEKLEKILVDLNRYKEAWQPKTRKGTQQDSLNSRIDALRDRLKQK